MATLTLSRPEVHREPAKKAPVGVNHFHLGLSVADVNTAVAFYKVIFDCEPFKHYPDYAEFVSDDPALVLAITKWNKAPGGPINHIGLRFTSLARLEALHARLADAGFAPTNQGSVNCCYAKGTKVWAVDPDHNLLELYVLEADLPQFGYEEPPALAEETTGETWEHRSPEELPTRIPHVDGSLDEVGLIGSFNAGYPQERITALLTEVKRVLKTGGKVKVQGMVGDKPFPGTPDFPGLASRVKSVPVEHEFVDWLRAAGFTDIYFEMHGDIKCLQAAGVQLRKVRLVANRPRKELSLTGSDYSVRYLGPFEDVELDGGLTLRRGVTTEVPPGVWQQLKTGPATKQFAFYADQPSPCCGGNTVC